MAISFVGSHIGTHAATSAQSIAFSNLKDGSGATPTLAQNDIVLVTVHQAAGSAVLRTQAQLLPTGYTVAHASVITGSDSNSSSQQTSYKIMGSTPDTTITIPASVATTSGVAYSIFVFRGVNTSAPMDVTTTTISGTNGAIPNPPSITPNTAGAWIYCAGGGAMAAGAAPQSTAPTGLDTTTNAWRQTVLTTTTNDPGLGAGFKSNWSSGAFDCPVFTGFTSTNTGSWAAVTVALSPAPALQPLSFSNGASQTTYGFVREGSPVPTGSSAGWITLQTRTSGSTLAIASTGNTGGGRFTINSSTGQITTTAGASINFSTESQISLDIVETLAGYGNSPNTSTVTIKVKDIFGTASQTVGWDAADVGYTFETTTTTTVTTSQTNTNMNARANVGYAGSSTQKAYLEYTLTAGGTGTFKGLGLADAGFSIQGGGGSGFPGGGFNDGFSLSYSGAVLYDSATQVGVLSGSNNWVTGDVFMLALDIGNKTVYLGRNGTWLNSGNPSAGTGGFVLTNTVGSWYPFVQVNAPTDTWTANFGATAFTYTTPTGFNAFNAGEPVLAWTPATPSGLTAWYDLTDLTTVLKDDGAGGFTPVTADGDKVSKLLDKSGNGHTLVQSTSTAQPVYRTGGGKPYLELNGAQSQTLVPLSSTLFAVSDGSGQQSHGVAGLFTATGASSQYLVTVSNNNWFTSELSASPSLLSQAAGASATGTNVSDSGPSVTAATATALTSILTTSTIEAFVNGTGNGSTTLGFSPDTSNCRIFIGSNTGVVGFTTGRYYGSAHYAAALGSTDHANLVTYLQSLYTGTAAAGRLQRSNASFW